MAKVFNLILAFVLCLAVFDTAMNYTEVYSVNWDIFFYVSLYGFLFLLVMVVRNYERDRIKKMVLLIIGLIFVLRIGLNLLGINKEYKDYSDIVNNEVVDKLTWGLFLVILVLILWRGYRHLQ